MNVIGIPTDTNRVTFIVPANTAEVLIQLFIYRRMYQRLPVFGAEYDMQVVFYE